VTPPPGSPAAVTPEVAHHLLRELVEGGVLPAPFGPLVVVDLDAAGPPRNGITALGMAPCVTVAFTRAAQLPDPTPFDVQLCERGSPPPGWVQPPGGIEGALGLIGDVVGRCPQAATVFTQLMRARPASVEDGLLAESLAYSALQSGPELAAWLATRAVRAPHAASDHALALRREGPTLVITLDRPAVRNAFSVQMRDELVEAVALGVADASIESVRLEGNGPSFCAGGDLREFGSFADPSSAHLVRTARSAPWWLDRCAAKLCAFVHGPVVGAGVELSAYAGLVVAAPGTTFSLPEVGMGLIPGAGGTVSIPRRIGRARTAYLGLSGAAIDAALALEWGLVDEIAERDQGFAAS
jgi:enoyl-CoA hydratase/carnithine racemase